MDRSQNYFKRTRIVCRKGLVSLLTYLICIQKKKRRRNKNKPQNRCLWSKIMAFPSLSPECLLHLGSKDQGSCKCIDLGVKDWDSSPNLSQSPSLPRQAPLLPWELAMSQANREGPPENSHDSVHVSDPKMASVNPFSSFCQQGGPFPSQSHHQWRLACDLPWLTESHRKDTCLFWHQPWEPWKQLLPSPYSVGKPTTVLQVCSD